MLLAESLWLYVAVFTISLYVNFALKCLSVLFADILIFFSLFLPDMFTSRLHVLQIMDHVTMQNAVAQFRHLKHDAK